MKTTITSSVRLAGSVYGLQKNKLSFVSKNFTVLLANVACVFFMANTANGQNLVADSLFATNSRLMIPESGAKAGNFIQQPDGKIIYGGTVNGIENDFFIAMMRFDECGILDTSFGINGKVRHKFNQRNVGKAFALQADGKIVCVGVEAPSNAGSQQRANVSRFNSDGTPDTTFNVTGSHSIFNASGSFDSVHIMEDGRILCFGFFGSGLGSAIARFMPDGTLDTSFNTDGLAFFNAPFGYFLDVKGHVLADGKMIVTSYTSGATSDRRYLAVRFLASGELDTTYGNNGYYYDTLLPQSGYFYPLTSVIDSNGNLLMSKGFDNTSFDILRLTPEGILDNTFGTGGHVHYDSGATTTGMQLFADGKIFVRGSVRDGGNNHASGGIRFLADGTPDATFGTNGLRVFDLLNDGGTQSLNSLLVLPNGQWITAATNGSFYFKKYGDLFNFPHISQSGTVLSTTGTGSYQWFLEGTAISGAINQTYTPTQNGNYTVIITDVNGCTGISSVFNISNLAVNSHSFNSAITISPNPSAGIFNINSIHNIENASITVFDSSGRMVFSNTNFNTEQTIDINALQSGIYVLKISGDGLNHTQKIIRK